MKYTPDDYGLRCQFDAFCKTVLKNEAKSYHKEMKRQRDRETPFEALPLSELDKLCTVDQYPSDSFFFRSMAMTCASTTSWWPLPLRSCPSRARVS